MKRFCVFLAILSLMTSMMASPVSKKAAAGIAKDFFAQKATNSTNTTNGKTTKTSVEVAYESNELYVFNGNGGFVVVSADDQTEPVLAWSDNEQFDAQEVNPSTKMWLESYKQQIQALKDNGGLQTITLSNYDAVAPIVPFQWNQPAPYNKFVPMDEKTGQQSVSGCTAISLGQVMATVKYPDVMPRGIPAQSIYKYDSDGERKLRQNLEALPATSFDWSKMATYYDADDQSDAPDEVAKLIKYCGYAQGMVYSSSVSLAQELSAYEGARLFFGYSEIKTMNRASYPYSVYEKTIYDELKEGRPVIYGASTYDPSYREMIGHSFIIDGYKDGYYHVNWGWGGKSDGYFVLSVLNTALPEEKGINGANGYNIEAEFVYGFKKPTVEDPADGVHKLAIAGIDVTDDQYSMSRLVTLIRTDENADFPAFIEGVRFNRNVSPFIDKVYDVAWNLYNPATDSYVFAEPKQKLIEGSFPSSSHERQTFSIAVPKGVPNGTYRLHWMFRDCKGEKNTDKWYPCIANEEYYLQVTIDGNRMDVVPSIDDIKRDGDLEINSVSVDGEAKVYKDVNVKFNITNYTNTNNRPVFMWVSNDGKDYTLVSGRGLGIDKYATGDVYMSFLPELPGKWYIALMYVADKKDFDAKDNLLAEGQDVIEVEGTSLQYEVKNLAGEVEKDTEELLGNSIVGEYEMITADEAPCTETMYIVLEKYDKQLDQFIYNIDPNSDTNKMVVGEFKDDSSVIGQFSFTNLEKNAYYRLSVGELVDGKVNAIYAYYTNYIYKGQDPSAVSNIKAAQGSVKTNIYFDLSGRPIEGKPTQKGFYIHDGVVEAVQ